MAKTYEQYLQAVRDLSTLPEERLEALRKADREGVEALRQADRNEQEAKKERAALEARHRDLSHRLSTLAHSAGVVMAGVGPESTCQNLNQISQSLRSLESECSSASNSWNWVTNARRAVSVAARSVPQPTAIVGSATAGSTLPAQPTRSANNRSMMIGVAAAIVAVIALVFFLI